MTKILHKSFPLKIEVKDDNTRTVEGWASTFGNKDLGGDIILPGAFADSLKDRKPKMLWQHNTDQVIGVWDTATETDQGLYVKGRILDTTLGNDAYKLAQAGAIDSMSIGYSTIDANTDYDTGIRTLKKLELYEVSLVTFPMNEKATITAVKAMAEDVCSAHDVLDQAAGICSAYMNGDMEPTKEAFGTVHDHIKNAQSYLQDPESDGDDDDKSFTPRKLERLLREAGLSKREARGFVAQGYPALNRRDADGDKSELISLFNQFTA
jgi:HK97 family phage prohead protease